MSIETATIRERTLLHLSRFPHMNPSETFNIPFELTQDGIARVLGISRAHASLELKKLKEIGMIDDWRGRVKGSGNKRIVYYLLPDGVREADLLRNRFEKSGIAVEALLDMKRCDPGTMWENLNRKDKESFGVACVFRIPIPRNAVPETTSGVIPVDLEMNISIIDDVRNKYISLADPNDVRSWHGRAAEWYMDHREEEIQERLYHLVNAGRSTEACRFLINETEKFLFNPNEDLLETVKKLVILPKHTEKIYNIRAKIALACEDTDDAKICADVLADFKTNDADLIMAEVYMLSGEVEKGFKMAKTMYDKDPSAKSALIAARCLFKMKKHDEAASFITSSCNALSEQKDASSIDEILILRAGIAYDLGRIDETLSYLNKAEKVSRKESTQDRIAFLAGSIKEGMKVNFY
ncbi:CDC27 family protein [Candidatus Methanoplasma termitum]|nr:CDC27 family protein [Candidatus Methanoplasma termitum]MCL2333884.1 helix-turn-helix domain-containing protein [Candidatus Methanoplasma sp.]